MMTRNKLMALGISLLMLLSMITTVPAYASQVYYDRYGNRIESPARSIAKKALIGAGIGALAGGLLSHDNRTGGLIKGALIGGAVGGGYGYLKEKGYLNRWGLSNDTGYNYNNDPYQYSSYNNRVYDPYTSSYNTSYYNNRYGY